MSLVSILSAEKKSKQQGICFSVVLFVLLVVSGIAYPKPEGDGDSQKEKYAIPTALIASGGVIAGAILTALAAAYTARQKIKEVEMTYQQKLQENYLASARLYTNSIYVPASMALRKLSDAYKRFRGKLNIDTGQVSADAESAFRRACDEYKETLSDLFDSGADAFLTTELEERLRSFNSFLDASMEVTEPVVKMVLEYSMRVPGAVSLGSNYAYSKQVKGRRAQNLLGIRTFTMDFLGLGFTFSVEEIVAAPIASREFEQRIASDLPALKFLIKEVTLGAHTVNP